MKNRLKKMQTGLLLSGLLFFIPVSQAQDAKDFFIIGGVVKNSKNKKNIEYVNVSAAGTNVGTVTNENGEFILKISNDLDVREIELSCLGYYNARYGIERSNRPGQVFFMAPRTVELQEVEVVSWKNPADLVEAAIRKISKNYSQSPNLLTCFYRETIQKRRKYITISEAVTDVYKSSYQNDVTSDRTRILKGRKLLSPNRKDTLGVKLIGGPNLAVYVDAVKNPDVLLDEKTLPFYTFRMGEIISIDDRLQYAVHFRPQVIAPYPLFEGTFYIDRETLAFTRIVFNMEMRDKEKVTSILLKEKPAGLRFTPEEVAYIVTYKYRNGKSYLNYIRDEMRFRCDWKRRLFSTPYTVVSEMVVTDRRTENIEKIDAKKAFSERKSLSDEAMIYYDSDFWGAYNIIEPTESLESAVGKLKKTDR
ncbi:MAG: carboxypeptidase-like regulatory domain-containing protein [Dysgonamonadaceae bacterium]|jgi:hypothetical protein|nr:carboxypeptidase-like regulatory domain-containing protein [Dysgonamonadaceae bacterium]